MFVLVVDYRPDYGVPDVYGPFEDIEATERFAERYRKFQELPIEATPDNREDWTELGWHFGIVDLSADTASMEAAMESQDRQLDSGHSADTR